MISNNVATKMLAIYVVSSIATIVLYMNHLRIMEKKADAHYAAM